MAVILGAWLCFLPWAFGTMHVWSQFISLGLSLAALGIALVPREEVAPSVPAIQLPPWRQALRLPLVWLTLLLFVYVGIQAVNHGWSYRQSTTQWWLVRARPIAWLPSGIDSPFNQMSAGRRLLTWAPALFASLALWLGVVHRNTVRLLVVVLSINVTAVGAYAIVQHVAGMNKVFWTFEFPNAAGPYGSFIYKNHGAAFLLIGFAATAALSLYYYLRGMAQGAKSTPAPVLAFFGVVQAAAIVFSMSRLGAILVASAAFLFVVGTIWQVFRDRRGRLWVPLASVLVLTGGFAIAIAAGDTSRIEKEFTRLALGISDDSPAMRLHAYAATKTMFLDYPLFGIGAGGFRYLSPVYLQPYPAVTQATHFGPRWHYTKRYAMNEAHSDLLQFSAELGLIGGGILLLIIARAVAAVSIRRRRKHPIGYGAWVALITLLGYAAFDFPFHNPAVLGTLALLITASCRWIDLMADTDTQI